MVGGALGVGFSGIQLWGLQWCYDLGGLLRQQGGFCVVHGTHRSISDISPFQTVAGTRGRKGIS